MSKIKEIEKIIANVFRVEDEFVHNPSRKFKYTVPKKVLCMVLVRKEDMKQVWIAKHMNFATHSNVGIHVRTGEGWYETDPEFRNKVDQVYDKVNEITVS